MNAWDIYEDLTDIAAVRTHIEKQMDEYNASSGVVRLNLILFRDAVEHVCRIVRVISQVSATRDRVHLASSVFQRSKYRGG